MNATAMNATQTARTESVRIPANNAVTKRLGNWTTARQFQVRSHRGVVVLDLRSPQIPAGDIEVEVDLENAVLKLLVPDDAPIEDWDLRRSGRGRVKDAQRPDTPGDRRVVLTGALRHAEIRVHRGGVAMLSAMFSREYVADLRRAHKQGLLPTVDDPTRTGRA
ncbi:hypothetical protein [Rugosimonospora africana]|uniref:Uncharacterized protein n=1 Tax=Rugosimonospora africana TaxID=556532 RepID=A0A8J3QRU6_9ACTN|nr:hypothetical protein [Rugosimonospora africana]GIH14510.1 hypothetical protein Raf01_26820 [Rugosimonospora africana]